MRKIYGDFLVPFCSVVHCNILDFHGFLFAYVFHYVILACCSLVFYFFYAMQTYYYPQPYIKV